MHGQGSEQTRKTTKGCAMRRMTVLCLVILAAVAACGCGRQTDQDKIKRVVGDIQSAGEQKDVKKIMARLSKSYSDPQGYDYDGVHGLLVGYFFRYPKISVYVNELAVTVDKTSATASFQAVLTSGEKTGSVADVIPQTLGVWNFNVSLKNESGDWKVTSAEWEEAEMTTTTP